MIKPFENFNKKNYLQKILFITWLIVMVKTCMQLSQLLVGLKSTPS